MPQVGKSIQKDNQKVVDSSSNSKYFLH
jgi:hypothetical protein